MTSGAFRGLSPGNDGIKPSGFVNLGADTPVVHGIDVSKYQDEADFTSVKKCGGTFVYVRMSAGSNPDNELLYRTHWANTRAAGLIPGPYHNVSVVPGIVSRLQGAPRDVIAKEAANDAALAEARASGVRQADLFISRIAEVLKLDPGDAPAYLPAALDLSARPGAGRDVPTRQGFSKLYGGVLCSFLQRLGESSYGRRPVMLFAEIEDLTAYDLGSTADRCAAVQPFVWVRHRPRDGERFSNQAASEQARSICRPDGVAQDGSYVTSGTLGRCIMEQYTSFGGFALFDPGAPLDLNRIFGTPEQFGRLLQSGRLQ